jgi:hypothetical protein
MKKIIILILFIIGFAPMLEAQIEENLSLLKTTYPVDSCFYFMDPFNMRINQLETLAGGKIRVKTTFRSSPGSNPTFMIRGVGRFFINPELLPEDLDIENNDRLVSFLTLPSEIEDPGAPWQGENLPFPVLLDGFLMSVDQTPLDPGIPIAIQVFQLEVISLLD